MLKWTVEGGSKCLAELLYAFHSQLELRRGKRLNNGSDMICSSAPIHVGTNK